MKIIKLPKSTSECDSSPIVNLNGVNTIIKYGNENIQVEIFFKIVYGFKYTDFEYINTIEYAFGLVEIEDSGWINELLDSWKKRDRPISEAFGKELSKIHHYRLCFDEYGMYEVICKSLEIYSTLEQV